MQDKGLEIADLRDSTQGKELKISELQDNIATKEEELVVLKENIKARESLEDELANSKKLMAKLKKKFASLRDEKQAELEQKDEDISRLLDRVAEVENLRRSEGQNVDEEIRKLTERILEAEQKHKQATEVKNKEIVALKEMVGKSQIAKDEAIQEKDNKISKVLEQLKQVKLQQEKLLEDKESEILSMKEEFEVELDRNNEFVVNQINILKRELAESRSALAEKEDEVETLRANLSKTGEELLAIKEQLQDRATAEAQSQNELDMLRSAVAENQSDNEAKLMTLTAELAEKTSALSETKSTLECLNQQVAELENMHVNQNELLETLRMRDIEVNQLKEQASSPVFEETLIKADVSQVEQLAPLTSADDSYLLLQEKEIALQKQTEQLQIVAKKFAGLKKKFGVQKDQLKELSNAKKKLEEEKNELQKDFEEKLLEFRKLLQEKEVLESSLSSKESILELLNSEVNSFQEKITTVENENFGLKTSLESKNDEISILRQQLDTASERLEIMEALAEERDKLSEQFKLKDEDVQSLSVQLDEFRALAVQRESEIENLRKRIDEEFSIHSEQLQMWKSHVESSASEVSELKVVVKKKQDNVVEKEKELISLRSQVEEAVKDKVGLSESMNGIMAENERLKSSLEELESNTEMDCLRELYEKQGLELRNLKQEFEHLMETRDEIVGQKRSLERLLQVRDVEVNDLRNELERIQDNSKYQEELLRAKDCEIEQLNESVLENSNKVIQLLQDMAVLKNEGKKLEERFLGTGEELVQSQSFLKDSQKKVKELEKIVIEARTALEQYEKRNVELEETCEQLEKAKHIMELNLRQAEGQVLELRRDVKKFEERSSAKDRDITNLREQEENEMGLLLSKIEEMNVEIQSNVTTINELSRELETAKSTISDLELERSSKTEELRNVEASPEESNKGSLEDKIADLEKEKLQLRKKLATVKKASMEIGKQHKQFQTALNQKEKELAQLSSEKQKIEDELKRSIEELRNEKDSIEMECEDTVKEIKEVTREKQELTRENNSLKSKIQDLESEKEWNLSELENLRVELDGKTGECLELGKDLEASKESFHEQMKKRLDEVLMEKELEKADLEEEFAKQVNDVCAQKDQIISELKKRREDESQVEGLKQLVQSKDDLISKLEKKLSSKKEQEGIEIDDLRQELHAKCKEIENLNKSLTGKSNEQPETMAELSNELENVRRELNAKNDEIEKLTAEGSEMLMAEIQNLKDELQILGEGREALDKRLHEVLTENQKLYEQLQIAGEEKNEKTESKQDLTSTLEEKDKKIMALKNKIKELRKDKIASETKPIDAPQIVHEVFQKSEISSVQAVFDIEKQREEVDHLRHERNVYEESYIKVQRDLDQTQRENDSLHEVIRSKQDLIDAFDSQLQQEKDSVRNEMQQEIKEVRKKMSEREKEIVDNHLEEKSHVDSLIEELKEDNLRLSDEIVQLKEQMSVLVNNKEDLERESSDVKQNLKNGLGKLEAVQVELLAIKEKCQELQNDNSRLEADVNLNKKGKLKLKQKLKETMQLREQEKSALQAQIQDVKSEKAETCNTLRTEFGAALDSRDQLVNNLREKMDELKTEKLHCEEKYETENRKLKTSLEENVERNLKLESEVAELKISVENMGVELAHERHEKDTIGDSIRAEFDHICSGLRMDLERVLKEKDEISRSLEVGRLGLEKELINKEETFDGLMQIVKEKDEILNSENLLTLKAEVERLKQELSTEHETLKQERGFAEQKNVVIQILEEEKKRLMLERDDLLEKKEKELGEVRSSKDAMIDRLEARLSDQENGHEDLKVKYEEICREFRLINEHIVSCVRDDDPSLLEVLHSQVTSPSETRLRSNKIVSLLLGNWSEISKQLEKERRDWQSVEESLKLELEKRENEKEEKCKEIEKEWQGKMAEKDEEIEALVMKMDENQQVADNLGKEKNELMERRKELLGQLNEASLKLEEKEQELIVFKNQAEKACHDIEELNVEKQSLNVVKQEMETAIAHAQEEIDRLQLDVKVLQNERNHFEQSLIENTTWTNESFLKLFGILEHKKPMQSTEQVREQLPKLLSDLVRQVRENEKIQQSLKEEKTRVCNEIREEFENALMERESILEQLRERLKNSHKEYDVCKNLKVTAQQHCSDDGVIEESLAQRSVVEDVIAATTSESLMADISSNEPSSNEESLKEQLESLQTLYRERNTQVAELSENVMRLHGENEVLKDMIENSKHSQSSQETHEKLSREIEQLQLANERLKNEARNIENEGQQQLTAEITQLKAELEKTSEERAAYEKLHRDFDHIVSGLRGDLERVMSDRDNTSRMLDTLRSQVHEKGDGVRPGSLTDKAEHNGDPNDRSLKEVEKELASVRHRLHEMSLVNRQLKELGKTLNSEIKETRRDKQHAEKKCQNLRDEMESFVKEKESMIVQSRERMETIEKLHRDKQFELQQQYEEKLLHATQGSEYKELSFDNERLQMKLNDAYEQIRNIGQLQDTLKQDNEVMQSENTALTERLKELTDLVNDAGRQIELRDGEISKLNRTIRASNVESRNKPEAEIFDDVNNDLIRYTPEIIKTANTMELGAKPGETNDVIEYLPEVTSESEKLERELVQTSIDHNDNGKKFLNEELEKEVRERRIVTEQLEREKKERVVVSQELEKLKKISTKLKNLLKNSRSEVEGLNHSLTQMKEEMLEKEHTMTTLRNEMAEIVQEKEEISRNLMSKTKVLDEQWSDSLEKIKNEYQDSLKKKAAHIEKLNCDLTDSISRGDELKSQLDMWRHSYNEVSDRANKLENEITRLKHSLQVSIEEHKHNEAISSSEMAEARRVIEELNGKLKTSIGERNDMDRLKKEVEYNLAELQEAISEKDSLIENLHREIDAAKKELRGVANELETQKKLYDDLRDNNAEDEVKFKNLQNEFKTSLSEKDTIILQRESELGNANERIHDILQRLQEKNAECDNLLAEKGGLLEQLEMTQKESQNESIVKENIIAERSFSLDAANTRAGELSEQLHETSSILDSERRRKEELDEISATLRKDLEVRTEQKRELEEVVMALNIDLEKALKDREELRQAMRVKQTVTQGTENPCFDEVVLEEKTREMNKVQKELTEIENELISLKEQLRAAQSRNENLEVQLHASQESAQENLTNAEKEKKHLEDVIDGLKHDLQQSSFTKEEAINVLRTKLEEAVEERGGAVDSLKHEYGKMLSEKDEIIASLQDEVQRVNEEFTNLGYRFELTLQDNVNKGNNIVQLQSQVREKQTVAEENNALHQQINAMIEQVNELENEIRELNEEKNALDSEIIELRNSVKNFAEVETRLTTNMKENEISRAKQKKEFKRLYEGLQFDFENCRKQNIEKEKSLQSLREELEEIMKEKEALAMKVCAPERIVEDFQESGDLIKTLREEKKELLRDLDKTRTQKDEIFSKFHNISNGLRQDLEAAINSRDEKTQECLKANVMLDKLQRDNAELEREAREREAVIASLNSHIEAKHEASSSNVDQLRAEIEQLKSTMAHESMNARETILKTRNSNEQLRQSLAKAEYDRENLRNYAASKEVQNDELKRQLGKEIAERKRREDEGLVREEITSSVEEPLNQTRTDLDETDTMFNASMNDVLRGDERLNKLLARLADAARVQEETNLQLSELEESLQDEKSRREELEVLLEEQHQRRDIRVNILDDETIPLTGSPAVYGGQLYQHRISHINRRNQTSLLSLRGCLQASGRLAGVFCGQTRGRWPIMLYLLFLHSILIVCLYSIYTSS